MRIPVNGEAPEPVTVIVPLSKEPIKRPDLGFKNPREEYIFADPSEALSMPEVARRWAAKYPKRYTEDGILKAATVHNWRGERENFLEYINRERTRIYGQKMAELKADELIEATKRHRNLGNTLQNLLWNKLKYEKGEMLLMHNGQSVDIKASDIIRAAKEGVAIERKALGLVEMVVNVQFAEELVNNYTQVVSKYVTDPVLLRSIGRDLESVLTAKYEQLENFKANE